MSRAIQLIRENDVLHAVLGNYTSFDGSAQRVCDQQLSEGYFTGPGVPTCARCLFVVEEMEKHMEQYEFKQGQGMVDEAQSIDGYLGVDKVVEVESFLSQLADEVSEWSVANFGDNARNPTHRPLLGILEEFFELEDALAASDREGILDAIADITIYMTDYFARRGWPMESLAGRVVYLNPGTYWTTHRLRAIKRTMVHRQLKCEQGIRGSQEEHEAELVNVCGQLLAYCATVLQMLNEDFVAVVKGVWESKVSKRDWVKNPRDAAEKAETNGLAG